MNTDDIPLGQMLVKLKGQGILKTDVEVMVPLNGQHGVIGVVGGFTTHMSDARTIHNSTILEFPNLVIPMDFSLPPNERAWRVFLNVVDHMHRRCESISMHAEECLSPPHDDTIELAHNTLEALNHLELRVWEWKQRDLYAARKEEVEANWSRFVQALLSAQNSSRI